MDEDFDADDALAPRSPGYTARGPLVWAELNFYQRVKFHLLAYCDVVLIDTLPDLRS
jgi:hypothetical protein